MLSTAILRVWHKLPVADATWQGAMVVVLGLLLGACAVAVTALPTQVAPLLLIAVLAPFLAMMVRDLRRLFLTALVFDIPFRIDINLGFREDAAKFGSIEGFNFSVSTFALVGLYGLWLGQAILNDSTRPRLRLSEARPLGMYVAVVALSLLVARDPMLSLFQLNFLVQEFLLFLYIVSTIRSKDEVLFLFTLLVVGLVLEGGLIVAVRFTGFSLAVSGLSTAVDAGYVTGGAARLGGTLGAPNNAAAYFVVVLPIAMSLLLIHTERWRYVLASLGLGLGGMALVITQSRGGWGAFAIAALIFCLVAWRSGKLSPAIPCVIGVVGILLLVLFQDTIAARFSADDNGAAYSRVPLMQLAFRMIEDNPVLGVGANNFAFCIPEYLTPELASAWRYTVHNKYLLLWAEIGTVGLGIFLWFFWSALRRGWQSWKLQDDLLAPLSLGITAALLGHASHMFAEAFNGRPMTNLLVLCTALLTVMSIISKHEKATARYDSPQYGWRFDHA